MLLNLRLIQTHCVCACIYLYVCVFTWVYLVYLYRTYIEFFPLKILIIVVFSQWYLFHFPLLTFSFLSGGLYNFTPTPQRSEGGRKRGWERESALKDWSLTNSLGYFDVTLTCFSQEVCFGEYWEMKFENLFYFRLLYMKQYVMDILSVCGHFWMEELKWMPKMWDERERERESELGEERESLWDWQGSVY